MDARYTFDPDTIEIVPKDSDKSDLDDVLDRISSLEKEIKQLKKAFDKVKQNASYQDFATPSKLDSEVEDILTSIKDDVMTSIKKTKYFAKKVNETS